MQFAYPSQRFQDWLSQQWVIASGRKFEPNDVPWLMGPFGECDIIADTYVARLAEFENLSIERGSLRAGLVDSAEAFLPDAQLRSRLQTDVARFYEQTSTFDLDVWSEWNAVFGMGGRLVQRLYSRRLRQLDLPQRPLETAHGIASEVIHLRCADGTLKYAVWYRHLKSTGQVVYSGVYTTCVLPNGKTCVKIVFPLPRGNATVLMDVAVGPVGELELTSAGERFGDAGMYLLLRDAQNRHHAKYVRSFRERITVGVDAEGVLRADHFLTLWHRQVLQLHYRMTPRRNSSQTPEFASVECSETRVS